MEVEGKVKEDQNIWSYDDPEAFADLSHSGYAMESDAESSVGGWLAHRLALQPEEGVAPKDWIQEEIAQMISKFNYLEMPIGRAPRILVLYGSLRETSFSRKLAFEFARLLEILDCDVRVYNPRGLPVRDPALEDHVKVQELRALTQWSDGHVWVSPEMHGTYDQAKFLESLKIFFTHQLSRSGTVTGTFKNQIDWIPLNTGSIRPTQGKTCLVAQVNGGSQSFNAVNYLRILARWMRMPCCTNQSSVAKAWQEFGEDGRMKDSSFRERVVDCAEEFAKFNAIMRGPDAEELTNRYSERKEDINEGRLLTQAEKDKRTTVEQSRQG